MWSRRINWRPVTLTLLIASLLSGGLLVSTACGGGGKPGPQLVVINQNLLHGILEEDTAAKPHDRIAERIKLVASALAGAHPDIIFLQEVLTANIENFPDIRATLLHELAPEYETVFGSILGDAIDTPGLGQMILTRLPILSSENHLIGALRTVVRVTVQTAAGPIVLYNAHLTGTDDDPQASVDELTKVLDFIDATSNGGPIILAGDFNARPDSPSIRMLIDAGFVDVLRKVGNAKCDKAGDPGCTNSNMPLGDNPNHNSDQRIDYIFVRSGDKVKLKPKEAQLFDNEPVDIGGGHTLWPSDHIGVRGVFELKTK